MSDLLSVALLGLLVGCGFAGGGGDGFGGAAAPGGAPGTPCAPAAHREGCFVTAAGAMQVQCDAATSQWQKIADCSAGQI